MGDTKNIPENLTPLMQRVLDHIDGDNHATALAVSTFVSLLGRAIAQSSRDSRHLEEGLAMCVRQLESIARKQFNSPDSEDGRHVH